MKNIKIFISNHKNFPIKLESDIFIPIHVGKINSNLKLNILGDDTGDNISNLNGIYAELTGIYWVWKNYDISNLDYIGFYHYRRYFAFENKSYNLNPSKIVNYFYSLPLIKNNIIQNPYNFYFYNKDYIIDNIKKYNIILPKPQIYSKTMYYIYSNMFGYKTTKLFINILKEECSGYENIINNYFYKKNLLIINKTHNKNLFIMDKNTFENYCKFLFNILNKFYDKIKNDDASIYVDKRVIGIFGELMIDIFIQLNLNKFKIKELPIINIE